MRKILFLISMLCSMTAAWAGNGTGSPKDPYTGYWNANVLISQLKEGDHLAYNCSIDGDFFGNIFVYDDKLDNANVYKNFEWKVGDLIGSNDPYPQYYKDYYSSNSPEIRQSQTFIVTKAESPDGTTINITGHYSGRYSGGYGSKEHPFTGEWDASELTAILKPGDHIANDCQIKNGNAINVYDAKLNNQMVGQFTDWTPGDAIGESPASIYEQYCKYNTLEDRKKQVFIVTEAHSHQLVSSQVYITGYFSGLYPEADGFVHVDTTEKLWNAIKADARAKVRLTADFALSDINKDGETYCETFSGIIDGNGHTIKGDPVADIRSRTYMFTYCDSATIKNLTFKGIRIDNRENHNQAVIASQAKNGCVFENITFDHISTYVGGDHDNTGAVVGHANTNCTFKNITVKNSDFTANRNQAGTVVGHAENCTFENIKVEHCESTARNSYSGGVAGRTDDCTISNVEILGTFIKTEEEYGGGVVGRSKNTQLTNCIVDDQSCVCVDGDEWAFAGGIVGAANDSKLYNCINSALVAASDDVTGGITGACAGSDIVGCLNTGLVVMIDMDEVKESLYNKYKTKTGLTCVTKTYQGKEYVIRKYEGNGNNTILSEFGGIAGFMNGGNVSKCVNFGSIYCHANDYAVGGIVGNIENGTISDCLSDFSGDGYGICRFNVGMFLKNKASVNNCLNLTSYKDIAAKDNKWGDFQGGNNYSLTTAEDAHHTTKTTAAKIKSGEICHLLGEAWEQNVGTDAYPTPTDSKKGVYHTRKVSNQYGTVCLPFPVQSDDKISYYSLSRKEEDGEGIKLVFTYNEDSILEGTPLLFRSAEAKDPDADNPVEICFNNAGEEFTTIPRNKILDAGFWDLWGTFEQRVFEGDLAKHIYYVSGGEIRNAKRTTIAPYRAWIYGENIDDLTGNGASQAKSIRFVIEDEDGETTALELVGEDLVPVQKNSKTYSIMGTEVSDGYRGLVIRNGKIMIQKR